MGDKTDSASTNIQDDRAYNVKLKIIWSDIWKNIDRKNELRNAFIFSSVFSLLVTLLSWLYGSVCLECIREFYNSVLPSLLGFSITVYTVLFNLNDSIIDRLKKKADDGRFPYEVLHATFLFGILIQGVVLILGIFANSIVRCLPKELVAFICWFALIFIIVWTINMVLHLYALRTFGTITDKKEK